MPTPRRNSRGGSRNSGSCRANSCTLSGVGCSRASRLPCASAPERSRCGCSRPPAFAFARSRRRSREPMLGSPIAPASPLIALVGNPNCGKTALFNVLTGSRQKVANYAGVTVDRKEGSLLTSSGHRLRILDLPGAYSLDPLTPDEQVTVDILLGRRTGEPQPNFVVCVTDATNLRQNLRLVLSLKRLGLPMLVALNMSDIAHRKGFAIDPKQLAAQLGVPVVETVGVRANGVAALAEVLERVDVPAATAGPIHWQTPTAADVERDQAEVRRILIAVGGDRVDGFTFSDRIDAIVLHPLAGPAILAVVLFLVFQAVFAWAQVPMDAIKAGVEALGA